MEANVTLKAHTDLPSTPLFSDAKLASCLLGPEHNEVSQIWQSMIKVSNKLLNALKYKHT